MEVESISFQNKDSIKFGLVFSATIFLHLSILGLVSEEYLRSVLQLLVSIVFFLNFLLLSKYPFSIITEEKIIFPSLSFSEPPNGRQFQWINIQNIIQIKKNKYLLKTKDGELHKINLRTINKADRAFFKNTINLFLEQPNVDKIE